MKGHTIMYVESEYLQVITLSTKTLQIQCFHQTKATFDKTGTQTGSSISKSPKIQHKKASYYPLDDVQNKCFF